MTDFSSPWDRTAAMIDRAVDQHLGDRINYSRDGGPFVLIQGFVIDEAPPPVLDAVDEPLGIRKRVKISREKLPVVSMQRDRLQHPRLGEGTFRPVGTEPATQGRYWLFDVQACSR